MLRVLEEHRVKYVVIGGMAAILQGVPLERTLDVDVTPARTRERISSDSQELFGPWMRSSAQAWTRV